MTELIKSCYKNETVRANAGQTGSKNKKLLAERKAFYLARRDTINLTVPFLQDMFEKQGGLCPVSEIELVLGDKLVKDKSDWRWMLAPSVDRLDNYYGYTMDNVQIVTRFVNVGFKDFSGDRKLVADILWHRVPRPIAVGLECFCVS